MDQNISIEKIENNEVLPLEHLNKGNLLVCAAEHEFLYVVDAGNRYDLFLHVPGQAEGKRNKMPKDEHSATTIRNYCGLAKDLYSVEYDKQFDMGGVLVAAEEAVLSARRAEQIEFTVPGQTPEAGEGK